MNASRELEMVLPGLVEWSGDEGAPQLRAGVCSRCGHNSYPFVALCTECDAEMQVTALGGRGVIYSHTTIRVKPPLGLPRPYSVAWIDLDDVPLRVFGLLDSSAAVDYSIGQPVELKVGELGVNTDDQPCLRPYFSLSAERFSLNNNQD